MKRTTLGRSDVEVSRICMGAMSFGEPNEQHPWCVDYDQAKATIAEGLRQDITFFDTAYVYNMGTSEEYLGRALAELADREQVQIATKFHPAGDDERAQGFDDAGWIRHCFEESLRRLGTDYVDLYICHSWGYENDMHEVLRAMSALVDEGRARAIGMSNCFAWQLAQLNDYAEANGLHRFESIQGHYNLLNREEEREMIPYCRANDVAVTPYSSLAGGRLTRLPEEFGKSRRGQLDHINRGKYGATKDIDEPIIRRVAEVAKAHDCSMTTVAVAWQLTKVTAPVIGMTRPASVASIVDAVDLTLTQAEIDYLEELYQPHNIVGVLAMNKPRV